MNKISWLHISDLHLSEKESYDQNVVANTLLTDLSSVVKKRDKNLDFIFITGDLAYSGKKSEYIICLDFINKLSEVANVPFERIVVVPGNHDVNRDQVPFLQNRAQEIINERNQVSIIIGSDEERKSFLRGQTNYYDFLKLNFPWANKDSKSSFSFTINFIVGGIKVSVLALNSAWLATGTSNEKGNLVLGERQVREALEKTDDPNIVIALMHHSFEWLKWFDRKDVKGMLDRRADFILSGHEHLEDIFQKVSSISETIYVSAGSLYDSRNYSNTYNIVDLDVTSSISNAMFRQFIDRNGGQWVGIPQFDQQGEIVTFKTPERIIPVSKVLSTKHEKLFEKGIFQQIKEEQRIVLPTIPNDLIEKLQNNECLLFAGAGASMDAGLPTWHELLSSLIEKGIDTGQFTDIEIEEINKLIEVGEFLVVAEVCRTKLGEYDFAKVFHNKLSSENRNSRIHKLLAEIPFSGSLTTNFDSFIETNRKNVRTILPSELNQLSVTELKRIIDKNFPLIKLHGTYDNCNTVILTHGDYNKLIFNKENSKYRENLRFLVSNKSLFFIGFSFRDPNIDFTLQEVISSYGGTTIPHYAIIPDIGKVKAEYFWKNYNIRTISLPVKDFGWKCLPLLLETIIKRVRSSAPNSTYAQ